MRGPKHIVKDYTEMLLLRILSELNHCAILPKHMNEVTPDDFRFHILLVEVPEMVERYQVLIWLLDQILDP